MVRARSNLTRAHSMVQTSKGTPQRIIVQISTGVPQQFLVSLNENVRIFTYLFIRFIYIYIML